MNEPIPPQHVRHVDAMLRGMDPRLSYEERYAALREAAEGAEYVIAALAGLIAGHYGRMDQVAGRAPGSTLDTLRTRLFAQTPAEDLVTAVEPIPFPLHRREGAPDLSPRAVTFAAGGPISESAPAPVPSLSEAAEAAEAKRRAALNNEVLAPVLDPRIAELEARANGNPELAGLLAQIKQRAQETQAVADADLDTAEREAPAPSPAAAGAPRCGYLTRSGPCDLDPGHPTAPGWPIGEDGHVSAEMRKSA